MSTPDTTAADEIVALLQAAAEKARADLDAAQGDAERAQARWSELDELYRQAREIRDRHSGDDVLLDSEGVLARLAERGRPISIRTLRNYRSRPPEGWPQPVKMVGRTPLWRRSEIDAYAVAEDAAGRS